MHSGAFWETPLFGGFIFWNIFVFILLSWLVAITLSTFLNCCDYAHAAVEQDLFKELTFDSSIVTSWSLSITRGACQGTQSLLAGCGCWISRGTFLGSLRRGGSKRRAACVILQCFSSWAAGWEFIFVRVICMFVNTLLQLKVICVKYLMWFARTYKCCN